MSKLHPLVLVLALGGGCSTKPAYIPAGAPPPIDASGTYATQESVYSTTCRGVTAQNGETRVEHSPGARFFKLIHLGRPFDGTMTPDGSFTLRPAALGSGTVTYTTTIAGKFSAEGFYARVNVKVTGMPSDGRGGSTACEYQLRWASVKQ